MRINFTLITAAFLLIQNVNFAQNLVDDDYKKALWMTTRMYGGQRSGDGPNWLIMDHTPSTADMNTLQQSKGADLSQLVAGKCFTRDADGDHSLEGGWHDCGDHVKFGQTQFVSGYTLLKAYAEYPHGYYDYYSFDYNGYYNSGNYSWEGVNGQHQGMPNGIPDILDEVKYATDYFIQCAKDNSTFYYQVGEGGPDHLNWVTSVAMATLPKSQGGQNDGAREFIKNPAGASMASFCSATLALMSRVYRKFDPEYADLCLTHSLYAYNYAKAHPGTVSAGSFYPANTKWEDDMAIACSELYWATGDNAYRTEALSYSGDITNHNYVYNYNNNDDIAAYNLAKLGDQSSRDMLEYFVNLYRNNVEGGLFAGGDASWGPLRYNANAAFIVALWGELTGDPTVEEFIYNQIDYILGSNSGNHSFVVGFKPNDCGGCTFASHPHHRNVFQIDDIMADKDHMEIPLKNQQHGYMIGGTRNPGTVDDRVENYYQNEGGIDYNAGLVGALGYIVSRIAPVDTNMFGHPSPDLGEDVTICGVSSVTLQADIDLSNLDEGEAVTFKWYKGTETIPFEEGTTVSSVQVTEADIYRCDVVETTYGEWTTSDEVSVLDVLPSINLGEDFELCVPSVAVLDATIHGAGIVYEWTKDGAIISDATSAELNIYEGGTYIVEASTSNCASVTDEVVVSSNLLTVIGEREVAPGVDFTLSIEDQGGTYEWYDSPDATNPIETGLNLTTSVIADQYFYAKDVSSVNETIGLTETGSQNVWTVNTFTETQNQYKVTVTSTVTLSSVSMFSDNGGEAMVTISQDGTVLFESSLVVIPSGRQKTVVPVEYTLEPGEYVIDGSGSDGTFVKLGDGTCTFPYSIDGVVEFTNNDGGWAATNGVYGYFFDWVFSMGNPCDPTAIQLTVSDAVDTDGDGTPDSIDGCPLDGNKTEPGDCGCGVAEGTCDNIQTVQLMQGWNFVAFYLLPVDRSPASVFADVLDNIDVVKSQEGFYNPDQQAFLNSIDEFNFGEAYLVYANADCNLQVGGTSATTVTVSLHQGWNYLGNSKEGVIPTSVLLDDIWTNDFEIIKSFDAFNDGTSGTLIELEGGKGYFIKTYENTILSY